MKQFVLLISLLITLASCGRRVDYPQGGTIIFRTGGHTNCTHITFLGVMPLDPTPSVVRCYQQDGYMDFQYSHVSTIKFFDVK